MRRHPLGVLATRCLEQGLQSLTLAEEDELCRLFRKEARKGAFRATSRDPGAVLLAFCRHVQGAFDTEAETLSVVDFQPHLRAEASKLAGAETPLAALVLYATWIEHWLNLVIVLQTLCRGESEQTALDFFRTRPSFEAKIAKLEALELPPIAKRQFDLMSQIVKTRNRYVHYVWEGKRTPWVKKELATMRSIVRRADELLAALTRFEAANFDTPHAALAEAMFPRAGAV